MDKDKLANKIAGKSVSRRGNEFTFKELAPGIHVYGNIWPESMEFMKKLEDTHQFDREDYYDEEIGKKASTCWVYHNEDMADAFEEVVDSYLFMWDLGPLTREAFRITKFEDNEFFSVHPDDSYGTPRTASFVYYPNDNYEGGELEFVHFGLKYKPKAGELLCFPSGYSYQHKIHKKTGGDTRYTVVFFACEISQKERDARMETLEFPYQPKLEYILRK